MAQRKQKSLSTREKMSLAKKAADHKRLQTLADEATRNLKPTERWRTVTEEHKEMILYRLFGGDTVTSACKQMGIEPALINMAMYRDEEFAKRMAIARANGQATRVERLDHIPFDETLSDASKKLLSDNLKWVAARADRTNWGEKLEISGKVETQTVMPDWMFGQIIEPEQLPPPEPDSPDSPE